MIRYWVHIMLNILLGNAYITFMECIASIKLFNNQFNKLFNNHRRVFRTEDFMISDFSVTLKAINFKKMKKRAW